MKKHSPVWSALTLIALATACAKSSSPTQPSGATGGSTSSTTSGATMTTPGLVTPTDSAQIAWGTQPITLVVANALSLGQGTVTYSFQVASDTGFSNVVFTKDGVGAGNGQTSLTISQLSGSTTYYWRSHIVQGGTPGPNSKTRTFTVGPPVVLQAPVLAQPAANGVVGGNPTLIVNNVQRTGPAGTIVYRFDVASGSDFSSIVYSGTVQEQPGTSTTSLTVPVSLNNQATYWWRVQATDTTNQVTSPISAPSAFTVQLFDMRNAIIYDNPPDVGYWPETAHITYANTAGPYLDVDFDRRDGPDRWADVGFGDGALEYTLGACFNINNQWYCSAPVQFWYGRELDAGGPVSDMALNWYYNPLRWGVMSGHQPAPGELVGFWVGHGNLRGGNGNVYKERSNVLLVPFGTTWSASSLKGRPMSTKTSLLNTLLRRPGGK